MSFKPDYGLKLQQEGFSKDTIQYFYDLPVDGICVIENNLYSIMSNKIVEDIEYMVSFDFDYEILEKILKVAPKHISKKIGNEIKLDPNTPGFLEVETPFNIKIGATLGETQQVQNDSFVPLIIKEVII